MMPAAKALHFLGTLAAWARARRKAWQRPLLMLALAGFAIGCALSISSLELAPERLRIAPLVTMMLAAIPLSIAYSAVSMMQLAGAGKVRMGFGEALRVSVLAQAAELLPLPGGAMVRTAALMGRGCSTVRSTELVMGVSLMWIACGALAAGIALAGAGPAAWLLAGAGAAGMLATCLWLSLRYSAGFAVGALLLRIAGVALVAWRMTLAFAIIGIAITWLDAGTFAFATILGSAAALVPAGLGVGEGLAALLAAPAGLSAASAFLAAALSRVAGLAVNLVLALALMLADRLPRRMAAHG